MGNKAEVFECKNNHQWAVDYETIEKMVVEGKNILEIKCPVCGERYQKSYATDIKEDKIQLLKAGA